MTRRKGVKAEEDHGLRSLLDSRAGTITIVGKSSLFHVTEVLRTSADENLAMIRESIAHLVTGGREVIFDAEHFFDGWKVDAGYSITALRAAAEAGARMVVLCDTNGGTMPEDISRSVQNVVESVAVPVAIHCHNDPSWPWPIHWLPSKPGPCRCKARSTGSASAAATSI